MINLLATYCIPKKAGPTQSGLLSVRFEAKYKRLVAAALLADPILGVALLIIGICAIQCRFMPTGVQYAMIGAGSTYLVTTLVVAVTVHIQKLAYIKIRNNLHISRQSEDSPVPAEVRP